MWQNAVRGGINVIMNKVFVVIPAYNEEARLPGLVKKLMKYVPLSCLIVVDDGSKKRIDEFLPNEVLVVRHKTNLGKGMALRTGCDLALMLGAGRIVLIDADGQHDPKEIPCFLKKLEDGYRVVFGVRRLEEGMPKWRMAGNIFLRWVTDVLFELNLSDVWCGYRAFDAKIYKRIIWDSSNYSSDVEMAVNVALRGYSYTEHFVGTIYHDKVSVTGTTLNDGLKLLIDLVLWRFKII